MIYIIKTTFYYRNLHKQNRTGKNTAIAIVMGQNQLSSDEYGFITRGPEGLLNFLSLLCSSPHSPPPISCLGGCGAASIRGSLGNSVIIKPLNGTDRTDQLIIHLNVSCLFVQ